MKLVDPREFPFVVGHECVAECDHLSCDQQVIAADRLTHPFKTSTKQTVGSVGWSLERQDVQRTSGQLRAEPSAVAIPYSPRRNAIRLQQ